MRAWFDAYWHVIGHRHLFAKQDTTESLLELACRILEVLQKNLEPRTEILGVEQPLDVPQEVLLVREVVSSRSVGIIRVSAVGEKVDTLTRRTPATPGSEPGEVLSGRRAALGARRTSLATYGPTVVSNTSVRLAVFPLFTRT